MCFISDPVIDNHKNFICLVSWGKSSLPLSDLVQSPRGVAVKDSAPLSSPVFTQSCILRTAAFIPRSPCGMFSWGLSQASSLQPPYGSLRGALKAFFSTLIRYQGFSHALSSPSLYPSHQVHKIAGASCVGSLGSERWLSHLCLPTWYASPWVKHGTGGSWHLIQFSLLLILSHRVIKDLIFYLCFHFLTLITTLTPGSLALSNSAEPQTEMKPNELAWGNVLNSVIGKSWGFSF